MFVNLIFIIYNISGSLLLKAWGDAMSTEFNDLSIGSSITVKAVIVNCYRGQMEIGTNALSTLHTTTLQRDITVAAVDTVEGYIQILNIV